MYSSSYINYISQVQSILQIPKEYQQYYYQNNSQNIQKQYLTPKQVSEKLKVICLIGITGAGKSSTANSICGIPGAFKESGDFESCTQKTVGQYYSQKTQCQNFIQTSKNPFLVIDTPGLCDTNGKDPQNIANLVCFLKNLAYVNSFVITFNSQEPRLDENKISILKLFSEMFGKDFFDNVIICFTRWSYDQKEEKKRKIKNNGKYQVISQMQEQFQQQLRVKLNNNQFMFIDNDYNNPEFNQDFQPYELQQNQQQFFHLHQMTMTHRPFFCKNLQSVMNQNQQLQKQIELQSQQILEVQQQYQAKIEQEKKSALLQQQQLQKQNQERERQYQLQLQKQEQERKRQREEQIKREQQAERQRQQERQQEQDRIQRIQQEIQQQKEEQEREEERKRQRERQRRREREEERNQPSIQELNFMMSALMQRHQPQYYYVRQQPNFFFY